MFFAVLKLNSNVLVTGFTLEHIPKSLAPNGRIDSAPKLFTVWVSIQIICNMKIFFNTFIFLFFCRVWQLKLIRNQRFSEHMNTIKMVQVYNIFECNMKILLVRSALSNWELNRIMVILTIHVCIDFECMVFKIRDNFTPTLLTGTVD